MKVNVAGCAVTVEGKLGKLEYTHRPEIAVKLEDDGKTVVCTRPPARSRVRAYHGLSRCSHNMMVGVAEGYEKKLEIQGVGYLAAIAGDTLQLRVGFANEVHKKIPRVSP